MDGRRFDDVARVVAAHLTRRRLVSGIAVGAFGALVGRIGAGSAAGRTAGLLATFEVNGERFHV